MVEPYKVSCVLLWNSVAGDWSSVGTWFGTYCAPGARMHARGLVYPMPLARTTWFGMPDVCSTKREWVEHGAECHEIGKGINIKVGFTLGDRTMGHIKLLLSKGASLTRREVS